MPEMPGHELAARAALRPEAPALFISGYVQPILDSHGVRSPHCDILDKPFTEAAPLSRVRKALARTPASTDRDRSLRAGDPAKSFLLYDGACFTDRAGVFTADLAISLDVIYHLA